MSATLCLRFPAAVFACLVALSAFAQSTGKKPSYTLHGTIEAVREAERTVSVTHEKIEDYLSAGTFDYKVDDPAMLNKLQPGDEIVATLYRGDDTLYNIRVVRIDDRNLPPRPPEPKKP